MENREYQSTHISEIIEALSEWRKVLGQMPTGGGKTVEFALIAQRYVRVTGKAVLILVDREELMYQAAKTIKEICGYDAYLITSETKKYWRSRVYIGMVDSTVRRTHMFDEVGLVIIDECHKATFNKIHDMFLEELIIGYTATPKSVSKKDPLNKYYHKIILGPQIKELIAMGHLAQNLTRCPQEDIVDSSKFEVDKLKGDFNEGKMSTEYRKPKYVTNVVQNYFKFCKGKKTIIFNVSIEHSKEVNECFVHCGYNSRHLDSNSSKRPSNVVDPRTGTFFKHEREEILYWFKVTEDAILNNVMIATVGFDEPTVINVILNFSTMSIVKFLQTCGRGGRKIDEYFINKWQHIYPYKLEEKKFFNIIDMGGNYARFGDWSDDRDWKYIFEKNEVPGNGIAPVKVCPACEGLVHAAATVCSQVKEDFTICGYEFERRKTPEEKEASEMVLVTKGIDVEKLIELTLHKHDYYLFDKLCEPVLKNLFESTPEPTDTQINNAFTAYYKLCIDYWKEKMAGKDGNIDDISMSSFHIRRAKNNFLEFLSKIRNEARLQLQN